VARECDVWFVPYEPSHRLYEDNVRGLEREVRAMAERSRSYGREIRYGISAHVICEATRDVAEAKADAVMHETLAAHPHPDAGGVEQVGGPLLEHAGAHTLLHIRPRSRLDDDRLDALEAQQMREHEPRGTGADDRDLGAHAARTA